MLNCKIIQFDGTVVPQTPSMLQYAIQIFFHKQEEGNQNKIKLKQGCQFDKMPQIIPFSTFVWFVYEKFGPRFDQLGFVI